VGWNADDADDYDKRGYDFISERNKVTNTLGEVEVMTHR
jgi:hypothetical protein